MNEADINTRIGQWLFTMPEVVGVHFPDSRRCTIKGWPDWVFIGPGGMLFVEVKGSNDTVTPDQRRVGRKITIAGGRWRVWWPRDISGGLAESQLKEIA